MSSLNSDIQFRALDEADLLYGEQANVWRGAAVLDDVSLMVFGVTNHRPGGECLFVILSNFISVDEF